MSGNDGSALDPLPNVLPPEGVVVTRLAELRGLLAKARRIDLAGVRGCADAMVVAALAERSLSRRDERAMPATSSPKDAPKNNAAMDTPNATRTDAPVVVVTEDADAAAKLASDVRFFLGDARVRWIAPPESTPYADANPDRRSALQRMATLAELARGADLRVLVVAAGALGRKVVPKSEVLAHTHRVVSEDELDRDRLVRALSDAGYLRVPVVEDPGTFAVRGSLLDAWPPGTDGPFRIELYGDLIVSIKAFDPADQTTRGDDVRELWLPPAREAILSERNVARARERVLSLADAIDWPTTKTRALVDDVATGRAFFGADGYLPAYYDALEPLTAYLPPDTTVVLADPTAIVAAIRHELERTREDATARASAPHFPEAAFFRSEEEIARDLEARAVVTLHRTAVLGGADDPAEGDASPLALYEVARAPLHLAASDHEDLTRAVKAARASKGRSSALAPVARRITHFRDSGLAVVLTARAETQAERLATLLKHLGVRCRVRKGAFEPAWLRDANGDDHDAQIVVGPLSRGAVVPGEGLALVTEEEIFGGRAHRARAKKTRSDAAPFLEDLRSLAVGDFVVHAEHGIGRYLGLVHKEVGGLVVDLLVVEYAGGDKLYLPVYRLNQIQKFSGGENAQPKIDRLGGTTFAKTKARVAKAVRQMADELLRLYAERQAQPGHALPPADDDYRAFEATFPFDETEDQMRAIEEVNKDLETPRPMDRLVCGDVGFGKTEIAIRAAFRVAMSGKQVAVLCPTTVLAQQHFRTFESRMGDYPVTLRALSRFQTAKEQTETLAALKEGKVDVVVGTHRLLSKDVHFKDLGLLVVDEEQRFGVAHKERIKALRTHVDVLTLSATPIPRTLQMAVSGIRDLSLITTPPVDRRAVRTFVTRMDDAVLREAIGRELSRGGQVFYVYNRIEGIYERAERVRQLFPSARIAVAHGQMSGPASGSKDRGAGETALEKTMLDFVEGRYDILVATAIVESGLDIPRANTIVIDRADLFGLSQLYQLRGRVGRSKERAYCYLVVPKADAMTDEARARIDALERHTELGSGFKIASLDLELRGAGDLLGADQSGTVASVGLDLFCSMLDEAVHELRGEPVVHDVDPELSFDVTALLPDDYVADVGVRLSLYKRLASAADEAHVADIAVEMENRFGPPPEEAKRLVQLMTVKCELRRLRVLGCEATSRSVTLHLREDTPLDSKKVLDLVKRPASPYKLTPDMRLSRRFDPTREAVDSGLSNCERMLDELAKCWKE